MRDRRRWNHADSDGDGVLNKREFKLFVFPHLAGDGGANGILVKEAHEELDSDHNGRVTQAEFMSQFHLRYLYCLYSPYEVEMES